MNEIEMTTEWEAWQQVCVELTRCSAAIDINQEDRLAAAIVFWGECLAALRRVQPEDVREAALRAAEAKL